eukprot:TRINITY_DN4582_c0_g1_i1.p1 TRINITY_DN4582_c0_g1~~TRINITY_DN4582_c0_g1_i1.p1  ORF type:complete len:639 (+),score=132.95 TRINITY_DN4582_c0_g1_i1:124-2040(+)
MAMIEGAVAVQAKLSQDIGNNLSDAAKALQASAAAARAHAQVSGNDRRSINMPPVAAKDLQELPAAVSLKGLAQIPAMTAGTSTGAPIAAAPLAVDFGVDRASALGGNDGNSRIAAMAITVRHKRAWSIQEALDQHSALCRQKETLANLGASRVRGRRTQLQFAKMEVDDALESARRLSPAIACDAGKTQSLAAHLRRATHDFALAQRLCTVDETVVQQHLGVAEEEIDKSRQEMKDMKQAIDDKTLTVATDDTVVEKPAADRKWRYCTNCKVGGHGQRFCEYLLKRPNWRVFPYQKWFEDEKHNEYHCPLGKRLVDFADESHFSRLAMYIKGRHWLEDKTKMWQLVPDLMPDTYVIDDLKWRDGKEPLDKEGDDLPWFVKEADRNWGTSVQVCSRASHCMDLAKPGATFVVQPHIKNPLLMEDGRKCHIKFYVLLMGMEDGSTWWLYTLKDGYLSISPNKWSATDLSKETQVTIIRTERITGWKPWPDAYPKCKAAVAEVVRRGVAQGKLEGRLGKRQFEILSADFIVDTGGNVWLFEFNMSPVLKDAKDSPNVHDSGMITAALNIVVPWEDKDHGEWDFAGEFIGSLPVVKEQKQQQRGEPPKAESGVVNAEDAAADAGTKMPGEELLADLAKDPP